MCLVLVAPVGEQIHAMFARLLAVYIPLGVTITVATMMLLVWVWRDPPGPPVDSGGPAEELRPLVSPAGPILAVSVGAGPARLRSGMGRGRLPNGGRVTLTV